MFITADIIEGRVRGKPTHCRKRMHLLSNLVNGKYVTLKRTAEDKKEWQKLLRAVLEVIHLLLSRLLVAILQ